MQNDFEEKPKGVLVSMEEDSFSGYTYTIWFPYTREFVKKIKEGSFIAIKNFTSNSTEQKFSVLEIVSAIPQHYALGSSSSDAERAFPAFFLEAAKSCRQDWEQDEPIEQTTVIKAQAISTGLQAAFKDGKSDKIEKEESLPMIGEEALLLSGQFTNNVVNQGLVSSAIPIITPGSLVLNPDVKIHISTEDLLRTHFGIFGFTGAGKSNLMSTVISSLMKQDRNKLKIFLFDLMSEYTGLLIDIIDQFEDSYIVVFGEDSLPGGEATKSYLYGDMSKENEAVNSIKRTILLPKDLAPHRDSYANKLKRVLQNHKIRVYDEGDMLTYSRVREAVNQKVQGPLSGAKRAIESWVQANLSGDGQSGLTVEKINSFILDLRSYLSQEKIPESFLYEDMNQQSELGQFSEQTSARTTRRVSPKPVDLNTSSRGIINDIITVLTSFSSRSQQEMPENMKISFGQL